MQWLSLLTDVEREAFIAEFIMLATDPDFITAHPAIVHKDLNGTNTFTAQADADDVETEATMAAITETGTYASTDYTFSREDWSCGLRYLQMEAGTEMATASGDRLAPARVALGYIKSYAHTLTGLIATAASTFSAQYKDASAAALTGEDLFDAIHAFETAAGRKAGLCVLHPTAVRDLRKDTLFTQASNAVVFGAELEALKSISGGTFVARLANGVDIYQSAQVPVVSSKRAGAIWARGGIGTCSRTPAIQEPGAQQVLGMLRFTQKASDVGPSGYMRGETYMGAGVAFDELGGLFFTHSY